MANKTDKLYVLPFDHRGSFIQMFGLDPKNLSDADVAKLCDLKHLVYEGFLKSLELGVPRRPAAILVDEQFGAAILQEAQALGVTRILTTEKSGQDEFDFEYGDDFGKHIDTLKPAYAKVLVRYNPEGDKQMNQRQTARLKKIGDFCKEKGYGYLFELLAVPTKAQLAACGGDTEKYEQTMRVDVMLGAIKELREGGVEPDVWKIEGLESLHQMTRVVDATRSEGRDQVGVVVLGRGESEDKVKKWLSVAAGIPGVIGFAVGRTVFKKALIDFHSGKVNREAATDTIAKNYKGFVDLFENAKRKV